MAEYYVDLENGDDGGNGSQGDPWLTLHHAVATASEWDVVWARGTAVIPETLSLPARCHIRGYGSVPGDGKRATLIAGFEALNMVAFDSSHAVLCNMELDCNHQVQRGVRSTSSHIRVNNCIIRDALDAAVSMAGGSNVFISNCLVAGAGGDGFTGSAPVCIHCTAVNCGGVGFTSDASFCIAAGCYHGFRLSGIYRGNIAYNNQVHGFNGSNQSGVYYHCIAVNNGSAGFRGSNNSNQSVWMKGCADFGNTNGRLSLSLGELIDDDAIELTANPFMDPDNGNFNLNYAEGGGAVLRALNFQLPGSATTVWPFGSWYKGNGGGGSSIRVNPFTQKASVFG